MMVDIEDGRGRVLGRVEIYYDTGRNWVARLASFEKDTTWNVDNGIETDGPTFQIAFDNLKTKLMIP